jgi:hypothetical protein
MLHELMCWLACAIQHVYVLHLLMSWFACASERRIVMHELMCWLLTGMVPTQRRLLRCSNCLVGNNVFGVIVILTVSVSFFYAVSVWLSFCAVLHYLGCVGIIGGRPNYSYFFVGVNIQSFGPVTTLVLLNVTSRNRRSYSSSIIIAVIIITIIIILFFYYYCYYY